MLKKQRDDLEKDEVNAAAKAGTGKRPPNLQVAQSQESLKLQQQNVKAQIQARNMEMEERAKRVKDLQTEIAAYRARIETIPINEQRYSSLLRDYSIAKADYDEKARKKGNERYFLEESERRPRLYQPARAEQHSAAGERAAGAPQAPVVLARLVDCRHRGNRRHERFDVLLLFWQGLKKMSRVHDALRRAEQAGAPNLENVNVPAVPPPVVDYEAPPRLPENGKPHTAPEESAPGGMHPVILENVPEVAFQPAPESHLLIAAHPVRGRIVTARGCERLRETDQQPVARRRQDFYSREPCAGRIAFDRKPRTARRFRLAPAADPQSLSDRSRSRPHRLPDG